MSFPIVRVRWSDAMNTHELAWAAGFFDGEGFAGAVRNGKAKPGYRVPKLAVSQSGNPFVLHRFQAAVGGLGRLRGPMPDRRINRQPYWVWESHRFEHVQAVIAMLWKWLSPVKREQATTALRAYVDGMRSSPYSTRSFRCAGDCTCGKHTRR